MSAVMSIGRIIHAPTALLAALILSGIASEQALAQDTGATAADTEADTEADSETDAASTEAANPAPPPSTLWRGRTLALTETGSPGPRTLTLHDEDGQELWREEVSGAALAFADDLVLQADTLPRAGGLPLIEVRYDGEGIGNEPLQWRAVLMPDSSRGRSFSTLWSGRVASRESGGRLRIEDLNGDGDEEVVLYAYSPSVQYCGSALPPLYPRVYDEATERFRLVSLRPALPINTIALETRSSDIALDELNRWHVDAAPSSVSGDATSPLTRSYGPAPESLSDHDPSTYWQAAGPNGGIGQFISFTVRNRTPLVGLAFVPAPNLPLPAAVLVRTDDGSAFVIELPEGSDSSAIVAPLPSPLPTSCVTISILEDHEGATNAAFGEVLPLTVLDEGEALQAFETHILAPYLAAESAVERDRLAALAVTENTSVISLLAERIPELDSTFQPPLVEALLETDFGRQAALELLMNGTLTAASIAAIGRSVDSYPELLNTMLDTAQRTDSTATRIALLRVLSRALGRERALELLPFVADAVEASRSDLAFGLGLARLHNAPQIAEEIRGESRTVPSDLILLRALSRIGRRERSHGRTDQIDEAAAGVLRAMSSPNGTVARLGHQVAGTLGLVELLGELEMSFADDEHPMIRLAALRGLASLHEYGEATTLPNSALFLALRDKDPSVRIEAAQLLRSRTLNDDEAAELMEMIRIERWPEAQRALTTAIIRQENPTLDRELSALLLDTSPNLQRAALVTWQSRRLPPPADALALFYEGAQGDETLQIALFRTFARIDSDEAGVWLRRWYDEGGVEPRARLALIEALGRHGAAGSRELLIELLTSEELNERRAAIRGLARSADAATREILEAELANESDPMMQRTLRRAIRAIRQGIGTRELLLNE